MRDESGRESWLLRVGVGECVLGVPASGWSLDYQRGSLIPLRYRCQKRAISAQPNSPAPGMVTARLGPTRSGQPRRRFGRLLLPLAAPAVYPSGDHLAI